MMLVLASEVDRTVLVFQLSTNVHYGGLDCTRQLNYPLFLNDVEAAGPTHELHFLHSQSACIALFLLLLLLLLLTVP